MADIDLGAAVKARSAFYSRPNDSAAPLLCKWAKTRWAIKAVAVNDPKAEVVI